MLARDYYAHASPDGTTPADRVRAAGVSRWALTAENIARCEGCKAPPDRGLVEEFQQGWMASPEHRRNILARGLDGFGFGIAADEGEIYAVQTFSGPGTPPNLGPDETPQRITPGGARGAALDAVNAARNEAGLEPLAPSDDLDRVAQRLLEARLSARSEDRALPDDLFGLLPENSRDWRSLSVSVAECGGCGALPTEADVSRFVSQWTQDDDAVGG